eukprot:TRINITY_DN234_c0_g1_i1.p1 TRINITY_DN234_c0_g1~~TRINITY_DN234_c0_g1_i1.p1  ORF type:complete len:616 (-),score=181.31 TRINITY_DN234_c0_g1_i1:97-1944(-)
MADIYTPAKKYPQFSRDQIDAFHEAFRQFDTDNSGSIDVKELGAAMKNLGETISEADLKKQIAEVDTDKSGTVDWPEFLAVLHGLTKGKSSAFAQAVHKSNKNVQKIVTASGGAHSFSDEEKVSFVEHINSALRENPLCKKVLPMNPNNADLFQKTGDGLVLCALINDAVPDTIDTRVVNNKEKMTMFMHTENLNLAINSAKAIGCSVVNVGASDIQQGTEHIILGLVWQIIRIGLLSSISLSNHPELFRLLEPGEEIGDLLKLSPEQILLRWFNYHLKKANSNKRVNNFTSDIKDSEAYTILLNQLAPSQCDRSPLQSNDPNERAERVLQQADKIGCRKFVKPADIVKGHPKLNLAFVANLFNTHPGLDPLSQEELAALEEWLFASEGTREARAFCLWINSLGIEPFVNNLFEDLRDGIIILKVMDIVQPGIVDWTKVNTKAPLNKFKKVENCNYAIVLGKQMKFSLVGIGGTDIHDGNQTLTLALVWQLMRAHVLSILKSLGSNVDEVAMTKWANDQVKAGGKNSKMDNFKDPSLKNSIFFLDLLNSIKKCVNYDLVTPGEKDEDATQNAKYTISIARKIGCTIFLLPEDIVEVKPKMILTLIGSIMSVALRG